MLGILCDLAHYSAPLICDMMDATRNVVGVVGGFPPCILLQIKNSWSVQGKQMVCLDQTKLHLVQEKNDFLLFECQTE